MNELFELWEIWLSGKVPETATLWGKEIYFWGRIGSSIQLVTALFIIAQFIGAERIRSFGQSLNNLPALKAAFQVGKNKMREIGRLLRMSIGQSNRSSPEYTQQVNFSTSTGSTLIAGHVGSAFVTLLLTGLISWFVWLSAGGGVQDSPLIVLFPYVLLISLAIIVALVSYTGIGWLIDMIFFRPLAWLLERESIDKLLKVASFVLLIIGFHFSLLAS